MEETIDMLQTFSWISSMLYFDLEQQQKLGLLDIKNRHKALGRANNLGNDMFLTKASLENLISAKEQAGTPHWYNQLIETNKHWIDSTF